MESEPCLVLLCTQSSSGDASVPERRGTVSAESAVQEEPCQQARSVSFLFTSDMNHSYSIMLLNHFFVCLKYRIWCWWRRGDQAAWFLLYHRLERKNKDVYSKQPSSVNCMARLRVVVFFIISRRNSSEKKWSLRSGRPWHVRTTPSILIPSSRPGLRKVRGQSWPSVCTAITAWLHSVDSDDA